MSAPKGEDEQNKDASGLEDAPPFPDSDAETIKEYAATLDGIMTFGGVLAPGTGLAMLVTDGLMDEPASFSEAVQGMIDLVHDILGNYEVARDLAIAWAQQSGVPDDIKARLVDHKGVLDLYWEGAAYDSFVTHFELITFELDKTGEKMVEIGETLTEAISTVHETYASAIEFIVGCAADLLASADVNAVAWFNAIGGILDRLGKLVADAERQIGQYRAQATNIGISAISFPDLDQNSKTQGILSEPKNWEPAPAPA